MTNITAAAYEDSCIVLKGGYSSSSGSTPRSCSSI